MALQRLKELPIKYIKFRSCILKWQLLSHLLPSQRFRQWLVTHIPYEALSVSPSKTWSENPKYICTWKGMPLEAEWKTCPHCALEKPHELLLPKRSQTSISRNLTASVRHKRTDGDVSKNSPGFPDSIATVFTTAEVNSYLGLRAPDPPCVGGCRGGAYLESILSSCLKFIWEGRRGFPCWQGANVGGAALLN